MKKELDMREKSGTFYELTPPPYIFTTAEKNYQIIKN